jgi:hypothetical protein
MRLLVFLTAATALALSGCSTNEAPAESSAPKVDSAATTPAPVESAAPPATAAADDAFAPLTKTPELDAKIAKFTKSGDKKGLAVALTERGNFRMNDDAAGKKVKYRAALEDFNAALVADKTNADAKASKALIEGIYQQLGLPVPGTEPAKKP